MKYFILDKDETPQGLPLKLLFQHIVKQLNSTAYQLWIFRSEGYGLKINEWRNSLDMDDKLQLDPSSFLEVSTGTQEWFYNLYAEITMDTIQIRFGLHDTTMLYIEAPEKILDTVVTLFHSIREIPKEINCPSVQVAYFSE